VGSVLVIDHGMKIRRWMMVIFCGGVCAFGGCLDVDKLIRFGAFYGAAEFLLDNDRVIDVFPDGAGA